MTNDLAGSYAYSSENLLTSGPAGAALTYDPNMRLFQVAGASTARFAYDGFSMVAEYNGANALQYRYVHGPGVDEALVQYDGPGTGGRRFLHADERGSIVAHSDSAGNVTALNRYDEYGMPASGNAGRLQYTGQAWLAEIGLFYYRARMYNPRLGRFMQTDPIGYGDGMNMYAYVGGDPVNRTDPTGLCGGADEKPCESEVWGQRPPCNGMLINGTCWRQGTAEFHLRPPGADSMPDLTDEVIAFVKGFSGAGRVEPDHWLGRDIGIEGLDGVEILEGLEERFGVDLRPLVDAHTTYLPPTWWGRLWGRTHGPAVADLTVRQLIEYIGEHRRPGSALD